MKCRVCSTPGELTTLRTVYINSKKYTYYICRDCNAAQQRDKYIRNPGLIKEIVKRYVKNNPQRVSAWRIASKIDTSPCEICGETRVHRHHPNPGEPTVVRFLCPLHHKQMEQNVL